MYYIKLIVKYSILFVGFICEVIAYNSSVHFGLYLASSIFEVCAIICFSAHFLINPGEKA